MTDYKNLKLIATSNPHIRGSETTRTIMLDVIIAMCPALIWAIIYFGVEALLLTAVSVIGCVVFEGLYRKLMHKPQSIDDLSAVVTGMLLAFVQAPDRFIENDPSPRIAGTRSRDYAPRALPALFEWENEGQTPTANLCP